MRYDYLLDVIDKIHPRTIMEIGVFKGNTSEKMIRHSLQYKSNVTYYGFDLFLENVTESDIKNEFLKMPETYKYINDKLQKISKNVDINLIKGNTNTTLKKFYKDNPDLKIDLMFLDGGHSLTTSENDWKYCKKFMNDKSVLVMDDYVVFPENYDETIWGVKPLVDKLDKNKYNIDILENYDQFPAFENKDGYRKHYFVKITKK